MNPNAPIRALIIDDEEDARFTLRNALENYCQNVQVLGEARDVAGGVKALQEMDPDLVFLDIRLSPGSGFDILEQLPEIRFQVIFVTAYNEYAMRAIRFSALDYLLKPVDIAELQQALERMRTQQQDPLGRLRYKIFQENLRAMNETYSRIVLPTMEGFLVQEVKEIIRCEADRNYTHFFLLNGKKTVIPRTLKTYDELLSQLGFCRVHQSHLVNLKQITEYKRRKKGGVALLRDGTEIPVAESRKDAFIERFLG